jgi:hypothetical protein
MRWSGWQLQSVSSCLLAPTSASAAAVGWLLVFVQRANGNGVALPSVERPGLKRPRPWAHRRGRRQAAAVKPEDIGPRLVTSSAGKLASDTKGIAVRLCFMRELQVQWIRKLVLKEGEANRRPANSVRCGARSSKSRKSVLPRANARCRRRNNLDSMGRRLWPRSANSPSVHGSPRGHV